MKSNKFLVNSNGSTANSILIEGAVSPLNSSSLVMPIKINEDGNILIAENSGAQTNNFKIITEGNTISGSFFAIKPITGVITIKADTESDDALTSNGNYTTGNGVDFLIGDVVFGNFTEIYSLSGSSIVYLKP